MIDRALEQSPLDREPHFQIIGFNDDRAGHVGLGRRTFWFGREQVARISVLGFFKDIFGAAVLDNFAVLHDVDAVGHAPHDAEIVGDEQHGHAHLFL